MTYNILSQDLIDDNDYLYNKAEHLEWDYRKSRLLNELVTSGADVSWFTYQWHDIDIVDYLPSRNAC
jgi:mRNA deadenylase 3'-5' endonuclease subunit Ccr4